MADAKDSALPTLTGANVDTAADYLRIVDISVTTSKKILVDEIAKAVVRASISVIQTIWVPATAMLSRTTLGAAAGSSETATNKVMIRTLDFDAAANEFAQFSIRMPKDWDEGTITAEFYWSHAATTVNFAAIWGLQGVAVSNDDTMEVAFGTAQTVTDTGGTTNDIYVTAATSAMTIAGTPAVDDLCLFQVYRDAAAGGDTLAIDARLHGVAIFFTVNVLTDI